MTPNANFYFDYQQDKNSLSGVYNYNPMLESLNDAQKALILGTGRQISGANISHPANGYNI